MDAGRVLTLVLLFAALTTLGYYCLSVRRLRRRQELNEEEARRPLLAGHQRPAAMSGAASFINND